MSMYNSIDNILNNWAINHSIIWEFVYKDSEVRSFYLNAASGNRVQVWVDPPSNDEIIVHIFKPGRNSRESKQEKMSSSKSNLPDVLDEALKLAQTWANS